MPALTYVCETCKLSKLLVNKSLIERAMLVITLIEQLKIRLKEEEKRTKKKKKTMIGRRKKRIERKRKDR